MAKAKEIQKRRKSVQNTKKITRTMEMVSTAKFKKAGDRIKAARPYGERLLGLVREIASSVRASGQKIDSPLLQVRSPVKRVAVLMLTANRGLCAGYNNNVIRKTTEVTDAKAALGQIVDLHVSGKKGLAYCRFYDLKVTSSTTKLEDKPLYADVEPLASRFLAEFQSGAIDELHVVYTKFLASSSQKVVAEQLLPLTLPEAAGAKAASGAGEYLFEPAPAELLGTLIPEAFKTVFFTAFLHAAASEQVARMVAMKNATDAASDMIKSLTRQYNRARQTQITMEIAELLGGAEALKGK